MSKLNINDLLSSLQAAPAGSQQPVAKFVEKVAKEGTKRVNPLSRRQEEMMRR
jgi:hypothetical protein